MRKLLPFIALLFSIIVAVSSTTAQETATESTAKKEVEEQRKKALELLSLTTAEIRVLKIPENRILLLSQAAGLWWKYDEKEARTLIQEIGVSLKTLLSNPDDNHPQNRLSWPRRSLRQQVIQLIARYDLDLALEVLRNTRPALPKGEAAQKEINAYEVSLEQSLAAQAAANNPAVALKLAEQTLEKGFSYELVRLVEIVAEKDRPAAAKFLEQCLKKLQTQKILQEQLPAYFALNVLRQEFRARKKELSPGESMFGMKLREPILSLEELKKWNEVLCQSALRFQPTAESVKDQNSYALLTGLQQLLPDIEKYNPEYVAPINKLLSKLIPILPDNFKDNIEINRYSQTGDVKGLLAAAEKAPKDRKDNYYFNAVFSALTVLADFDLARQIINDHITDPHRKKDQIALVEWVAAQARADEGKIDEAIASLAGLENDATRADTMASIAESLLQKGNKKAAAQLLEKAYQYLNGQIETTQGFQALARITKDFVEADPKRALEIYEPPLESLNEVVSALTVICRFEPNGSRCFSVKDELMLVPNLTFTQGILNYIETMKSLGGLDFTRALEITGRFKNTEIRSYARLRILEAVLN
jgi:hypothetical protein